MNELVIIGKTTTTFGIKGELKVYSDFEKIDDAFKVGNKVLINNIEHTITNIRKHKNNILMQIDNLNNINDVLSFVGFNIYLAKSALNLKEDEYLYSDLIDAKVVEDGEEIGIIKKVELGPSSDYIKVLNEKEYLIPLVDEYIIRFDKIEKKLYTKNAKNLMF